MEGSFRRDASENSWSGIDGLEGADGASSLVVYSYSHTSSNKEVIVAIFHQVSRTPRASTKFCLAVAASSTSYNINQSRRVIRVSSFGVVASSVPPPQTEDFSIALISRRQFHQRDAAFSGEIGVIRRRWCFHTRVALIRGTETNRA
jgi:hypothetical protein